MPKIDAYEVIKVIDNPRSKYISFEVKIIGNPPQQGEFVGSNINESVRLKETYVFEDKKRAQISLKGGKAKFLKVGSTLISRESGASVGKHAFIAWKKDPLEGSSLSFSFQEDEGGTLGRFTHRGNKRYTSIYSSTPFIQIPGHIYKVYSKDKISEFVLVMAQPYTKDELKQMEKRAQKFNNFPGLYSIYSMNLRIRGAMAIPHNLQKKTFDGALKLDNWAVMSRLFQRANSFIEKRAKSEKGIEENCLETELSLPRELIQKIVDQLIGDNKIYRSKGYLFNLSDDPSRFLSPFSKSIYLDICKAGLNGYDLTGQTGLDKLVDTLERRGLIQKIDGLLISKESYDALVKEVLDAFKIDEAFTPDRVLERCTFGILSSKTKASTLIKQISDKGFLKEKDGMRVKCVQSHTDSL